MDPARARQLRAFFVEFGYVVLPGLLRDEIGWITEEFEALLCDEGIVHDPARRTAVSACIERRERLCGIIDLPRLTELVAALLGDDWAYFSSDGNCYSGDTCWHEDSSWVHGTCIKVPLYLDALTAETGALRLIPGSHRCGADRSGHARTAGRAQELWGVDAREVPCVVVRSSPGDVIAFDTNLMHASFGGGVRRRMIAIQFWTAFRTPDQFAELDRHMSNWAGGVTTLHSELMHRSGDAGRRRRLRQVTERHAQHPRYRDRPESRGLLRCLS
jgi:ectoine hydroxylase-related dioxygenase (phytanoyl-CoA dioxygenase family)